MPSKARINARNRMIPEVERIIDAHKELRKGRNGPDDQKSLLRSSILLLCGAWELYCESVTMEASKKLARYLDSPQKLPVSVQKQLVQSVHHENVHKSAPLKLAGEGWRKEYLKIVKFKCQGLHTPKSEKLNKLFLDCLGLKNLSSHWPGEDGEIDRFVSLRGEIAHRGSEATSVSRDEATHYRALISKAISNTDDAVYDFLKQSDVIGRAPWQKTGK